MEQAIQEYITNIQNYNEMLYNEIQTWNNFSENDKKKFLNFTPLQFELNFSEMNLEEIPIFDYKILNINSININLSNNSIKSLKNLNKLCQNFEYVWLNLSYNLVKSLNGMKDLNEKCHIYLNLSHNHIKDLKYMPNEVKKIKELNLSYNRIKELKYIPERFDEDFDLNLSYNSIQRIEDLPQFFKSSCILNINLEGNPLKFITKDINSDICLNIQNTPLHNPKDLYKNVEYKNIVFENVEYKVITLKKGTLLFRNTSNVEKIKESFVGFGNGDNYVYPPQHKMFATMNPVLYPYDGYGDYLTFWVLTQNVNLLVKHFDVSSSLFVECNSNDKRDEGKCFNSILSNEYKIRGFLIPQETGIINLNKFMQKTSISSNVSFYTRKNIHNEDYITPKKDYDLNPLSWFEKHLNEFVMKPLFIINLKELGINKVNDIYEQLLSKEGYKDENGQIYHMYQNNLDKVYYIREYLYETSGS